MPVVTQRPAPVETARVALPRAPDPPLEGASAVPEEEPVQASATSSPPPAEPTAPAAPTSALPAATSETPAAPAAASEGSTNAASLGAQIAAIDAARRELRAGNPRGALATVEAFERRYGKSAPLSPEAMLVRVQAHLALGDRRLAESTATTLLRDHPTSVSARRAATLIGAHD
jgi:hypothetical protein